MWVLFFKNKHLCFNVGCFIFGTLVERHLSGNSSTCWQKAALQITAVETPSRYKLQKRGTPRGGIRTRDMATSDELPIQLLPFHGKTFQVTSVQMDSIRNQAAATEGDLREAAVTRKELPGHSLKAHNKANMPQHCWSRAGHCLDGRPPGDSALSSKEER